MSALFTTSFPGPLLFPSPIAREENLSSLAIGEGKRRGPVNEVALFMKTSLFISLYDVALCDDKPNSSKAY